MSKNFFYIGLMIVLNSFLQVSVYADYGRIQDPHNPGTEVATVTRCGGFALPLEKCEKMREVALENGCITLDELKKLREWGLAPMCVPFVFSGLDQYRGWCSCGCLDPSTEIDVEGITGLSARIQAKQIIENSKDYRVQHMNAEARISLFELRSSDILYTTQGVEAQPLVVIETQDGRTLRLTRQHAILIATGEMVQAQKLSTDALLVDRNGKLIAIRSISQSAVPTNVVNIRLDVQEPIEHVMFAEGIAVGDQAWQSSLEDLQNQILIRK